MVLSDRQIAKLRELARAEQQHNILARALIDERNQDLLQVDDLCRRIQHYRDYVTGRRGAVGGDVRENVQKQIAELQAELDMRNSENARRQQTASEHLAVASGITRTIEAVLAHARTSRRKLAIDFFRSDPAPVVIGIPAG
jgi:hypothetical protein